VKEHKPNWKKIKEVPVIGDVVRILSFFYSGLRVIALTAEKVGDKAINTIPEAVVSGLRTVYHGVRAKFHRMADRLDSRRQLKVFRRELERILMLKNPFYKGCIFTIVIFAMILGLQLISFNTTHAGADYYMRNIKKWAPVMFAAAVQGTIVLLSVFRFDSPRHERRRLRFLGAAVVISIAFSYVGIINGTIDPLLAYEPSKQNYEVVFNEMKAQLLNDPLRMEDAQGVLSGLNSAVKKATEQTDAVKNKIASLDTMISDQTSDTVHNTVYGGSGDTAYTKNTTHTSNVYAYDEQQRQQMNEDKAALSGALSTLENCGSSFDALDNAFLESLEQGKMSDELIKMDVDYQLVAESGKTAYKLLYNRDFDIQYPSIYEAFKKALEYRQVEALEAFSGDSQAAVPGLGAAGGEQKTEHSELLAAVKSVFSQLLSFQKSTSERYVQEVRQIQDSATVSYKIISKHMNEEQRGELTEAYEAVMNEPDANFVAFSYLQPQNPRFTNALVAMILAVLVDGGTLGLSLLKGRGEASPLYARERADFYEEEQDLLLNVFLSIQNQVISVKPELYTDFGEYCAASLNAIVDTIQSYLEKFKVSSATIPDGYSSYATEEDLNRDQFTPITVILLQLDYMTAVTAWEYEQLVDEYNGVKRERLPRPDTEAGRKQYYLLRSKAEIYLRQNIAETNMFWTMLEQFRMSQCSWKEDVLSE